MVCSKDICQERMLEIGEKGPGYVASSILSLLIKNYTKSAKDFVPFLQSNTNFFSINTERPFDKIMEEVNSKVEPTVIHIRPGANSMDLRAEISSKLVKEHGFKNLNITPLVEEERVRKTHIGVELDKCALQGQQPPAELLVRLLRKIIYSGMPEEDKFILSNFPEITEQAQEFEASCAKITALIYATSENGKFVEIKGNNLSHYNIDSMFQKEGRLRTMSSWNYEVFQEKLGNKTQYGIVIGRPCSGKTELSKQIAKDMGYQVVDMKAINEECKNRINAEREAKGEDPLEGEPPASEMEGVVAKMLADKSKKFVFDGFKHENVKDFIDWLNQFGGPSFVLALTADEAAIAPRWVSKYNEDAELDDEKKEAVKEEAKVAEGVLEAVKSAYEPLGARFNLIQIDTSTSLETTKA